MTPYHRLVLCAVVIVVVITAGCTSPNTSGPSPLATTQETAVVPPQPSAAVPAATTQPGAAGTQASSGTCTANINSDPANCGGCGYACPANAVCQQGQCFCGEGYAAQDNQCVIVPSGTDTGTGCPAGMTPCPDGYCYELASSPENCGICGNACPAGMICSASTCTNVPTTTTTAVVTTTVTPTSTSTGSGLSVFPGGMTASTFCAITGGTMCSGSCVNTSVSTTNCGTCGHVCKSLAPTCCKGTCTNTLTDSANCGSCGHTCFLGTTCISGSCKSKIGTGLAKTVITPVYSKIVNPSVIIGPIGP